MSIKKLLKKQKKLASGKSPLLDLLKTSGVDKHDKELCSVIDEIKNLGYSRRSFLELRSLVQNENNCYDLNKVIALMKASLGDDIKLNNISSVIQNEKKSTWIYQQNMIEYVNIRALGINDSQNNNLRPGNLLDFIVYILQSRSVTFHLAPFHNCSMDLLYSPVDTYSISDDIVSSELTEAGFSAEEQLKLVLDFGHARHEQNAFLIDCLPHTADLSLNYIYEPEQARWISLNPDYIKENKKIFNKGTKLIKLALEGEFEKISDKELEEIFSITKKDLTKKIDNNSNEDTLNKFLRRKLVLKTHLVSNKSDIDILLRQAERDWNSYKIAEYMPMVHSKDHQTNCKLIREIVESRLGTGAKYKKLQQSEKDYKNSIGRCLREEKFIFNLPVGAWNGGSLELVGFHIKYNYPIFACRGINRQYWRYPHDKKDVDVSDKVFGTISRRKFRLENGKLNKEALNEFVNAYYYWLMLGFDGLRVDQMNHIYYKDFDYDPDSDISMEDYFRENNFSYDTMVKEDIKTFISELKKLTGKALAFTIEDMMHYPIPASNVTFNQLDYLNVDSIIGNFQFMETMPRLLLRIKEHNLIKMYQKSTRYLLNTIECHDNNLTLGGTSPVCKSADGLITFRMRMIIDSIGLSYITTQAMNAVNYKKQKDSQIQNSINSKQNLNFEEDAFYKIATKTHSFNNFRHNLFDFLEIKEVKGILKGGIIKVHNGLTENSSNRLMFFTVHNKSPHYLLFVMNASEETKPDVWLKNTNFDWYQGDRDVLEFKLDEPVEGKMQPLKTKLTMVNDEKKRHALHFGDILGGEIKIYLILGM